MDFTLKCVAVANGDNIKLKNCEIFHGDTKDVIHKVQSAARELSDMLAGAIDKLEYVEVSTEHRNGPDCVEVLATAYTAHGNKIRANDRY